MRRFLEDFRSAPTLSDPDYSLPLTIQTDASDFGLGEQQHPDGEKNSLFQPLYAIEKFRPNVERR